MSTQFYNTPGDHSSDATFRVWGLALSTAIQAAGTASGKLTVTTDTGQINWTTVTRPGVSTAAGFEMYKFTDTLAGSAPIFIKIEYGTGGSANVPQMWITVGIGSNGSGTLTAGTTTTRNIFTRASAFGSTVTNYPTYVVSVEGFLGIAWKQGGTGTNGLGFVGIGRPCNLDASLRSDAAAVFIGTGVASGCEVVRFSDGVKFGSLTTTTFAMVTLNVTASSIAGNFQSWRNVVAYPQTYGFNFIGTILNSEIPGNTQDTATFYGSTSHNYISLAAGTFQWSTANSTAHSPFMIWE